MRTASLHPAGHWSHWPGSVFAVALLMLIPACASSPTATGPASVSERTRIAVHLLNRATYGARPQDVQEVIRIGPKEWLERQMRPAPFVSNLPAPEPPPVQAAAMQRVMVVGNKQVAVSPLQIAPTQNINTLVQAKLDRAARSQRQLEEVMTDFWFNHFNVFFNKGQVRITIADYEQNAIRPHVFGRFEDMLIATAQHPAMLVYLDNFMSTAPPDPNQPQRPGPAGRRGLNENYARELLELHTLGADRGYTQQDVIEVARVFTGWGIVTRTVRDSQMVNGSKVMRSSSSVEFQFQRERHDRGEKVVLGTRLSAGREQEEGLEVLRMLARHPNTAEHIATKLVQHFVADQPPQRMIDEIADVFRKSGGDLRAVTRALFTSRTFNEPQYYRSKVKRPFEFIASALRVTGATVNGTGLIQPLRALGHLPYSEAAPTGYPTTADEWLSVGAMLERLKLAMSLGAGGVNGVQLNPVSSFLGNANPGVRPNEPRRERMAPEALNAFIPVLLQRTLPGVNTDQLQASLADDLARQNAADARQVVVRGLGLVLGSPEFQRY